VTVTGLRADIERLELTSPDGTPLANPVLSYWSASLTIGERPIAHRLGNDTPSLFGGIRGLDLAAAVSTINEAVATDGTLPTSGVIEVAMDAASIATSLAGNTSATLDLTVRITMDVHVSKSAASAL
jgi:hypothetical protein